MSTRANKATPAGRSASRGIDFRPTISTFRIVLGHNKSRVLRRMPMADPGSSRDRRRRLDRTSLQPTPTPLQSQCHVDGTHLAPRGRPNMRATCPCRHARPSRPSLPPDKDIDHLDPSDLGLLETQDVESFDDRAVLVIALSDGHMGGLPASRHVFQLST